MSDVNTSGLTASGAALDPANPDELLPGSLPLAAAEDRVDWTPPTPGRPALWAPAGRDNKRSPARGKGRYDLLSRAAIHALALRLEMGAETHGDRSWELCGDPAGLARFRESMLRHAFQAADGMTDEDHLAAVLFNAMALIHFREQLPLVDQRGGVGPRVGG